MQERKALFWESNNIVLGPFVSHWGRSVHTLLAAGKRACVIDQSGQMREMNVAGGVTESGAVRLTMAAGSVAANPRYPTVSGHRPLTRSEAKRVCDCRRRHAEPSLRAGADKDASIHRQQIQPPQRKCRDHRTFRRSEQASEYLGQSMVHLLRLGEGETNPKSQTSPGPTALPACSPCPVADNGLRAVPCSTFLRRPVARGAATLFFAYCVPKQLLAAGQHLGSQHSSPRTARMIGIGNGGAIANCVPIIARERRWDYT